MKRPITMSEIARIAGVNESTVSRALNDSELVSEATRSRIHAIAREHGYTINATARSLRTQTTSTLGLVIPLSSDDEQTVSDPFFLQIIGSVCEAAAAHGYDVIVSSPENAEELSRNRLMATGRADGQVIIGQTERHDVLNALSEAGAPIIVWGGQLEGQHYATVGCDNVAGGEMAGEHLVKLGRKRILYLGDIELPEVKLRYRGFLNALEREGLKHDPDLLMVTDFAGDNAFRMIKEAMSDGLEFDAVCAASDLLALSAVRALADMNVHIPEDVSIVGFDDIAMASMVSPPLTTVSQDIATGGRRLVELLMDRMAGREISSELTDTKLVIRKSCGGGG
ncbi:MAG: LacI family DNA-binding transcriptional regulator [Pseudomonadota bacterium]